MREQRLPHSKCGAGAAAPALQMLQEGLVLSWEAQRAIFRERANRYLAWVEREGERLACHVANPGRLKELLIPGRPALILPAAAAHRRTGYDLLAVEHQGIWVGIDNRLGNRLLRWRLEVGLEEVGSYETIRSEVTLGKSRIDFLLTGRNGPLWLELKSCTLVEAGIARFPDAPTVRGRRHVEELTAARAAGQRAGILFLIQRPDAHCWQPHEAIDPDFGAALRAAVAAGVEVWAYTSEWSEKLLRWGQRVPVEL
jgi:sugar fermentation stimulation protein A